MLARTHIQGACPALVRVQGRRPGACCGQHQSSEESRGFSLVELLITLAILTIALSIGVPSMSQWLQNNQIRNAAESIQSGLQLARAEAVRRNTPVRFQLASNLEASCAPASTDAPSHWLVSQDDASGACDAAPSETTAPRIIQKRSANEGSANVRLWADQDSFIFNGTGRLSPVPASAIDIDIKNPGAGSCAHEGGELRCLRIRITQAGQLRMCDPSLSTDHPRGCGS